MLWITRNIHGLEWENTSKIEPEDILCTYDHILDFLNRNIPKDVSVAVKGSEKKKWLSKFIDNNIIDLTEINCPTLVELKHIFKSYHCKQHLFSNNLNCALENVYFLYNWFTYCIK